MEGEIHSGEVGLVVRHLPTQRSLPSELGVEDPFPYMCYYRTEVENILSRPLRIRSFEVYFYENRLWVAGNILGRRLTGRDFADGYSDGDPVPGGVIAAGSVAVSDPNWHGWTDPPPSRTKWVYEAVDDRGAVYVAELEVPESVCSAS